MFIKLKKVLFVILIMSLLVGCTFDVSEQENKPNNDYAYSDLESDVNLESEKESDKEIKNEFESESDPIEEEPGMDSETEPEPDTDVEPDHESESERERESEKENESEVDSEPESKTESETEPEPITPIDSTFNIHFIDVGQADAALVECDGHYMLIDGGNKADSNIIYTVLKNAKVSKLDIVVATHAHEDHVGGIPGAYNYTTADLTLCPITYYDTDAFGDFKKFAESKGGGITVPHVGDQYKLGSATIEILGVNSTTDTNNCSIVLMITYGDTKFLFTGDAEREAEQVILSHGQNLFADVLKVGHHGSESSTTYPFLREIMPKYAVISVGEDNSYGHPTDDVLSRLRDADVKVYRTDMQGDVYCTSDGKEVTFFVERNSDADTLINPVKVEPQKPNESDSEEPKPDTPTGTDYVLNTNTKKFHYPSCSSVKQMKVENTDYFIGTRDEVINMGYDPCGKCKP